MSQSPTPRPKSPFRTRLKDLDSSLLIPTYWSHPATPLHCSETHLLAAQQIHIILTEGMSQCFCMWPTLSYLRAFHGSVIGHQPTTTPVFPCFDHIHPLESSSSAASSRKPSLIRQPAGLLSLYRLTCFYVVCVVHCFSRKSFPMVSAAHRRQAVSSPSLER